MKYWAVRKKDFYGFPTSEFDTVQATEWDFLPNGDGVEIDMNGIDYEDYIASPENYKIEYGVLHFIRDGEVEDNTMSLSDMI